MDKKQLKSSEDFVNEVKVMAKWNDDCEETECLLVKEGRNWYLLQGKHDGNAPSDKRGYRYGWSLGDCWKQNGDCVCQIWAIGNPRPYIQIQAEETWKLFEKAIECLKVYGKSLENCEEVKALAEKIVKMVK